MSNTHMHFLFYIHGSDVTTTQVVQGLRKDIRKKAGIFRYINLETALNGISDEQFQYYVPGLGNNHDCLDINEYAWKITGHEEPIPPQGAFILLNGDDIFTVELHGTESGQWLKNLQYECKTNAYSYHVRSSAVPVWEFFNKSCPADDNFQEIAEQLSEEIAERLEKLRNMGVDENFIRQLFASKRKPGKMLITKDYRILLTDYDIEISLEPLPKAVYLLFLKHEDGIYFKELPYYREELFDIYKNITNKSDLNAVTSSLNRVTDPFDNSINEKCSRIKNAFVAKIDQEIASNYIITGIYGDRKRITLNRSLLTIEAEL